MITRRTTKTYIVSTYPEISLHTRKYMARYPQYQFEGSSCVMNDDGTMTVYVRYFKTT